jgi:hypothetical protein
MRKFLLASAPVLGLTAGLADTGFAQGLDQTTAADAGQGQAPGTVTVRLNGRFRFYAGINNNSFESAQYIFNPTTGATAEVPRPGVAIPAGSSITRSTVDNYGFSDYARLYPGFDGVAANGLKYGASLEIRQDNSAGAGGGTVGSISGQNRPRGALYLRREWGYIGTDTLGTLRLGSTDGPSGLLMTGSFENFNDGGWNGDVPFNFGTGNTEVTWPFADVGALYTTTKAVYLSPQFYGFDFGAAFEPSTANVNGDNGQVGCNGFALGSTTVTGQSIAGQGCDFLSSTSTGDIARRRNTGDIAVRYRGSFGPVGLAAYVNYIGSGKVNDQSGLVHQEFNGLSVGVGGMTVSYAGFSVGGLVQGGAYNGQWNLQPKGEPDAFAWLVGTSYTFGPFIVGASYFDYFSAGAATNTPLNNGIGHRRELGVAAGGTYAVAPGFALFLSYLWGQRHESGFDFLTNSASPTNTPGLHNTTNTQTIAIGTSFTW